MVLVRSVYPYVMQIFKDNHLVLPSPMERRKGGAAYPKKYLDLGRTGCPGMCEAGTNGNFKVPTSGPAPIARPHPVLPGPRPCPSPCCSLGAGREPRDSDSRSAFAAASSLPVSDGVAFLTGPGQARPELADILRVAGR